MATVTLRTKTAVVDIVTIMTSAAGIRCMHLLVHRTHMAFVAVRNLVRPSQFEVGFIVVKVPRLPATHVVALLALGTKTTLVYLGVIFFMA